MRNALTTLATTAVSFAVLATGATLVQVQMPAEAGTTTAAAATAPTHDICHYEDGSGQRVCVWPAQSVGNGIGDSFIAINGGTDRARYVYISDAKAYRMTHSEPSVCAKAAFMADDFAHTGDQPVGYSQAMRLCAASVGGF